MKKLLTIIFSLLISFNSYGEWWRFDEANGVSRYINLDAIKTIDEYVYWWSLTSETDGSVKSYFQGDCELSRVKILQEVFYEKPMGEGKYQISNSDEWIYLPPESTGYILLALSCKLEEQTPENKQKYINNMKKVLF